MEPSKPRILAQTKDALVVYKPSGWLTVRPSPSSRDTRPVLLQWVQQQFPEALPVHRLDAVASGVLLVSLGLESKRTRGQELESGKIHKEYVIITERKLSRFPYFTVNTPVEERFAQSFFEVLARGKPTLFAQEQGYPDATAYRVRIQTGRRHQIRLHAVAQGAPIVGDTLYGARELPALKGAIALHAERIRAPGFSEVIVPWPEAMELLWNSP